MQKLLSLVLLLLMLCTILTAGDEPKYQSGGAARQLALGGSPVNYYSTDYSNVYINPAYAVQYSDLVYSELGYNFSGFNASQQVIGFNYALWKGLTIGASIGKQEGPIFSANSYGSFVGLTNGDDFISGMNDFASYFGESSSLFSPSVTPRPLQLHGAFSLGGLVVGAAITRTGWSSKEDYQRLPSDPVNTVEEVSVGQTGFKAGVLIDLDALLLDASALLRLNSATSTYTAAPPLPGRQKADREINATGTEFGLNSRLFINLSQKLSIVPIARLYVFSYEPERKDTVLLNPPFKLNSKPFKYGRTDIELGIGSNIKFESGKIFAGLSFESISLKREYTTFRGFYTGAIMAPDTIAMQTTKISYTLTTFPKVNIGAEFEIASWLTGRIGYFKAFSSHTYTNEPPAPSRKTENTTSYEVQFIPSYGLTAADQLLSLGVGIHFDRFSLDGYLCEQWLGNGPFILSGRPVSMFGLLSMSYSFN